MQNVRALHVGEFEFNVKTVDNQNIRRCKRMLKVASSKTFLEGRSEGEADEVLHWFSGAMLVLFGLAGIRIAWLAATQSPGLWPVAIAIGYVSWYAWRARS